MGEEPEDSYRNRVYFESLQACNENCLFCVQGGSNPGTGYFSTGEAIEKISELRSEGWDTLVFDGGEPTLREDLSRLISHALDEGFDVNVLTNGVRLGEDEFFEEFRTAVEGTEELNQRVSVTVSLHSHRKEISEYLTQTGDSFEKTLEGLDNLLKMGIYPGIYHVITEQNYRDLPEFVEFLQKRFNVPAALFQESEASAAKIIDVTFSFVYPDGSALEHPEIIPGVREAAPYFVEAVERAESLGMEVSMSTCGVIPLCHMQGHEYIDLREQQDSGPENFGLADSSGRSSYEMSTEEFHADTKVKAEACSLCYLDSHCSGLWKFYREQEDEDVFEPVYDTGEHEEIALQPSTSRERFREKAEDLRRGEIVFVRPESFGEVGETDIERALNRIKLLEEKDLSYVVEKPLPSPVETDLEVPGSCRECVKIVEDDGDGLELCTGTRLKAGSTRDEAYQQFRRDLEKGVEPDCWMSGFISGTDSWPVTEKSK